MTHTVTLSWVASVDAVDGYDVFRGVAAGQETTKLNTALVTGTTFTDSTPLAGQSFYVAKASLGGVLSVASNEVTVQLQPAPPTNLVSTVN
jgi:hypothetical protein